MSRLSSGDKAVYSAVKERRRSSVRPRESVPISAVHKEKHRQPTHPNISSYDLSSAKTIDESFLTKTNSHEHDVEQFLEEIPSLPGHHLPVFPVFTSTFQG